ncbi:MAG: hypothetical protein GX284_14165 [Clostridiales bacterium]|nr:hypothetical protein [Clostridiales bacterium]
MEERNTKVNMEDLQRKMKQLDAAQEAFECKVKRVLQQEEEEDGEITRTQMKIARAQEKCPSSNTTIQQLLYEKQDRLGRFRREKISFDDEFRKEIRKRKHDFETDREKLFQEISNKKKGKENSYAKEKGI